MILDTYAKAAQLLATSNTLDPESFRADIAAALKAYEPSFADLIREIPGRLREDRQTVAKTIAWAGMQARSSRLRSSPRL